MLEEGDGGAGAARPSRAAHLVHVGAEVARRIVQKHVVHVCQVHASGHHVRADQHVQLVRFESGLYALAACRMQRRRVLGRLNAVQLEQLGEPLGGLFRAHEAEHATITQAFEQVDGQQRLLLQNHLNELLVELRGNIYAI